MAGELDVEAMLRRRTAKWFRGWQIYHDLEPFGEFRADVRAAQIVAMVFNMAVAVKDRKSLDYFLIDWGKDREEVKPESTRSLQEAKPKQTWQQQQKMMELLAMAFNAPGVNKDG